MRIAVLCVFAFWSCVLAAQELIVPHLTAEGAGFTTRVSIFNHSDHSVTWRLFPHAGDGTALPEVFGTLAPGAYLVRDATELLPAGASHFFVEDTSSEISVRVAYQNAEGRGSPAHVSATPHRYTSVRLFPGNWDAVFDGVAVVNTGDSNTDIEVVHFGLNGQELGRVTAIEDLAPKAKGLFVVGAPSGSAFAEGVDGYFEVRAAEKFAIVALRGTPPGSEIGYLWENPVLTHENFHDLDLIMTHLTRPGGGFSTQIIVQNQTSESQSFDLIPYTADGTALPAVTRSISRNQTLALSPETLLGQGDISHFKIKRSSRDVHLIAAYTPDGFGSPAHVLTTSQVGTSWLVSPGNWDEVFDGFAIVNLGGETTDVMIQQLAQNGTDQPSQRVACQPILTDLAPNAKGLFVLGGPNSPPLFDVDADTQFRLFSPMPLAVVPLRGSVPGSALNVLWPNGAFRLLHLDVTHNPFCDPEVDGIYFAEAPYASHTRAAPPEENKAIPEGQIAIEVKFVEVRNHMARELGLQWTTQAEGETITQSISVTPETSSRIPIQILSTESQTIDVITVLETQNVTRTIVMPSVLAAGSGAQNLWNQLSNPDRPYQNRAAPILGEIPMIGQRVTWQSPAFQGFPRRSQEIDTCGGKRNLLILVTPRIIERNEGKRQAPVLEVLLPCGETEFGLVLCPDTPRGDESDAFFFVYETVRGPIPLDDPNHYYQYGIVFDSDDLPGNNWVPHPDFPGDVYQGTDQWYSAEYTPQGGWRLIVSKIIAGNITPMASDARMVIANESLVLVVPKSEFASDNPGYRVTSYEHMGDYGNTNPWSGDVHPKVDEPLATLAPVE